MMSNFFEQENKYFPVNPPFLVPDATYLWRLLSMPDSLNPEQDLAHIEAEAGQVMDRHIERMAGDVVIKKAKKLSALIADSTVGLVFDQAQAQRAALGGRYAQEYFGDRLPELRRQYPIVETLISEPESGAEDIQLEAMPPDHPLTLLYAAWKFRKQVVIDRLPMSMVPVVGGESQGDTPSFTPVLQRVGDDRWQLGRTGDTAPVSPKVFTGDIYQILPDITTVYSEWYGREQTWLQNHLTEQASEIPDYLYIPAWAQQLRQEHTLYFGETISLTNVSHGRLYRLTHDNVSQLFRTTSIQAIKLALGGSAGQTPVSPAPAAIEEACLSLITGQGETASLSIVPAEKGDAAPLGDVPVSEVFAVRINGQIKMKIAWLKDHPKALGVVSGTEQPARAVLLVNRNKMLGLAPFSFKTKQPDLNDMWTASPLDVLDITDETTRRAVSAWAAWAWQGKSGQKKYQPPRR